MSRFAGKRALVLGVAAAGVMLEPRYDAAERRDPLLRTAIQHAAPLLADVPEGSVVLADPDLIPEAYFVALDAATGEYAGMSQLWHSQGSDDLYNGLTGVRRAYRRRGLALAKTRRGCSISSSSPQSKASV